MAFSAPNFVSRLMRPFTQSTRLALSPDASGSAINLPEGAEKAIVAAGCFWGVEHIFRKHFKGKGLLDARVGYIGGTKANPTYSQVTDRDRTGHAEAALLIFDPKQVTYRQLLEFFYKSHDPTTLNRQGNDQGLNYRSAIFYTSPEQEQVAKDVTREANEQWWKGKITTEVVEAGPWWDAEDYHQKYLDNNPNGYQCPTHYLRNFPELKKQEASG